MEKSIFYRLDITGDRLARLLTKKINETNERGAPVTCFLGEIEEGCLYYEIVRTRWWGLSYEHVSSVNVSSRGNNGSRGIDIYVETQQYQEMLERFCKEILFGDDRDSGVVRRNVNTFSVDSSSGELKFLTAA